MRSASVAWLAGTLGCRVHTLAGGYKAFRRWVLSPDGMDRRVEVVSGLTGSGKTEILAALAALGESVIDLEALARHKGSAFGDLGAPPQPTQEQFENDLFTAWRASAPERPVWLEDESRTIGRCFLPEAIWRQLSGARHHLVDLPDAARVAHLVRGYAGYPLDLLESRVQTISRRLGGDRAAAALAALRAGDPSAACTMILAYYDRAYRKCLDAVPAARITTQRFETLDPQAIAATLKTAATSPPP
jgi:tRNA 2-selenouridine synthase